MLIIHKGSGKLFSSSSCTALLVVVVFCWQSIDLFLAFKWRAVRVPPCHRAVAVVLLCGFWPGASCWPAGPCRCS